MKDSKLRQLVKESIDQITISTIKNILGGKMNLTAEEFEEKLKDKSDKYKLKAFEIAYSRGNTDSQDSLKTLLNQEPYKQLDSFVKMSDSAKSDKVSSNVDPNRQFGPRSMNEEQLRMQFLSGVITENEYKILLNGEGKKRG